MGVCQSNDETTQYIDMKLSSESVSYQKTNKILFLGPGGSGKSTIFKQLQWLHLDGFNRSHAVELKQDIYYQIVHQMKSVITYYEHSEEKRYHTDNTSLDNAISIVKHFDDKTVFHLHRLDDTLIEAIQYIWKNDNLIQNAFNDYQLLSYQMLDDSTEYFWNDIDRIKARNYVPNETDILSVRCRTTGLIQKSFVIETVRFHIFDVGGQRSERRKWIRVFNDVQAILFVISLECYNVLMCENLTNNCMVDSFELFDETINDKCFNNTHIILFLNKRDLFEKKIIKVPITECPVFSDFNEHVMNNNNIVNPDPHDFKQTVCYIQSKFEALNRNKKKEIFAHITNAMDRKNIDRVFVDVKMIIISGNLSNNGLLF